MTLHLFCSPTAFLSLLPIMLCDGETLTASILLWGEMFIHHIAAAYVTASNRAILQHVIHLKQVCHQLKSHLERGKTCCNRNANSCRTVMLRPVKVSSAKPAHVYGKASLFFLFLLIFLTWIGN